MVSLDENFDGKLAYSELRAHIDKLGFNVTELENCEKLKPFNAEETEEFKWRDKGLELIVRAVRSKIGKSESIFNYFKQYDDDHDIHLTPRQFRKACLDLNEPQLTTS